jgi:hypothetical protein
MRRGIVALLAVVAIPAGVAAADSTGLKVTGGGQVIASGSGSGPGDTIAFNAQQTGPTDQSTGEAPAKGQLQVIDRVNQVRFHGDVTCIRSFTSQSSGTFVRFGGYQKVAGQDTETPFTVDVQDNGEPNQGQDMILFRQRQSGDDPCDTSDESTDLRSTSLARGNVQDHSNG